MGLDVSVGSLTRYYAEGPADVVERIARHQGMTVTDGQAAEEVIRAAVLRWRENLSRWLGDRLAGPLDWDESTPAPVSPTSRAGTATAGPCCWPPTTSIPSCRPRAVVFADWPDDLAYQAASARGAGSRYSQLLTPELWLPCRFEFTAGSQPAGPRRA